MSCTRTEHGDPSEDQTPNFFLLSLRPEPLGHHAGVNKIKPRSNLEMIDKQATNKYSTTVCLGIN